MDRVLERAFLESFVGHLQEQGWLDRTVIAIDEREEEANEAVMELIEAVAPALADRIQLAGRVEDAAGAYDFVVNCRDLLLEDEFLSERRLAGKRTTFYTAGRPAHPNLFGYSPAIERRMFPWIAAKHHLDGDLRWAFNNWPHDVRDNPVYNYPRGTSTSSTRARMGPPQASAGRCFVRGLRTTNLPTHSANVIQRRSNSRLRSILRRANTTGGKRAWPTSPLPARSW